MKKTITTLLVLALAFFSCKKEKTADPEPPKIQNTYTPSYDTITYKAYGGHNWYEITYIERGDQKVKNPSAANQSWEYTFTDTVGALKMLRYKSSLDSDTMTAMIIINGAVTDSFTYIGSNNEILLTR